MIEHGYVSSSSSKSDLNEYGFVSSKKHCGSDPVQAAGGTARRRAGSTAWTSAGSSAEAGPSYRTSARSPLRRTRVTVPGLMSTMHLLWMTCTNREA